MIQRKFISIQTNCI